MDDADPTDRPSVQCDHVVIRYGETLAVDRLSFSARPGEILALLGPNGAGKTSTVEALEGYRAVAAGSVRVLGLDPRRDHTALVPRIGVMLQNGGVYPMLGSTQVLRLFASYYDDPADPDALVDLVGLSEVRRTPWRRLSGGEKQRLSLALALVGRPEVLFLDEPTAGVDPEGRIVVRDIISGQRDRGACVILTTHELAEAERLADRVVIIDRGRHLAEGTPASLASESNDGSIRFSTDPGIDRAALAGALGDGAAVDEEQPGHYRLRAAEGVSHPAVVAALTGWLAEHELALVDLRSGQSLEETYLAIVGARHGSPTVPDPEPSGPADGRRPRRRRGGRG